MEKQLNELHLHNQHRDIYGDDTDTDAIDNLADHLDRLGQITPIVITKAGTVISGARRVAAARVLGWKRIEAVFKDIPAELELFYIIQSNKQRTKTSVQVCNEIDALWDYYAATGPGPGRPKNSALPTHNKGATTRDMVAADLGISTKTIQQLRFIKDKRPDVLAYVGQSITLEAAYAQVRMHINQIQVLQIKEKSGDRVKLNAVDFQLYTKSSADMAELPDESIDHILTSPPYFGHRQFLPSNGTETLELGQEATARAYIDNLLPVLEECRRVMRPSGSIMLNMADSYSKANKMQIPERVSIEIQDRLGLILRNTLIWWKNTSRPPESSKRRRHTDFEYVYHFVKDAAQYYFDADAIRIPYVTPERTDHRPPRHHNNGNEVTLSNLDVSLRHAGGRIPGCVLEISRHVPSPAETNSPIRHTAAMNPQLARELLKPIAQVGDVILDPFSGSATTGAVALEMGCFYVGYDVNPVFNSIGAKRLKQQVKDSQSPQASCKSSNLVKYLSAKNN